MAGQKPSWGWGGRWAVDKGMSLLREEGVLCLFLHLGRVWVPSLLGEEGPLLCAQMGSFLVQGGGGSCLCRVRSHPPSSGTGRPI